MADVNAATETTFHRLVEGTTFTTPPRRVTEDDVTAIVDVGRYTHPLFADPEFAAKSAFGARVLPGQGVLLLMGGLVEQSGRFDETVLALVGFDKVSFLSSVKAGDRIEVEVEVLDRAVRAGGRRGLLTMRWTCRPVDGGDVHAEVVARMLLRLNGADGS